MAISDTQWIGFLKILLEQQKEILRLKCHLLSLEQIALENLGDGLASRILKDVEELQQSTTFVGTREVIAQIETLLDQALPTKGTMN